MKIIIKNYTFDATAKTVTLTDVPIVRLDRLQLITDVTTNAILYNFADSTVATAAVATNVITLSTVGTATSTDKLQIIYDQETTDVAVEPFAALSVNSGYQTLFYDSWSTALDTTDKWTTTGNAPAIVTGSMVMSPTLSSYNTLRSKDTVRANVGFSLVRNGIQLEASAATGCGRFWGLGTPATVPATNVLVQDGVGFEIDQTAGTLLAVTYANGVRNTVATLTRPSDGNTHAYGIFFRVTQVYWTIDGITQTSQSFPNVQSVELPEIIVRQNAAAFTGTPVFSNIATLTADTSRQGVNLADPIIGTRQARVKAGSTAPLASDAALVVTTRDAVTIGGTLPLPTGAATETSTASILARTPALGQATSPNSSPVVLPADYASTTTSKITDGTNTASVQAGDTGFNSLPVVSGVKTLSFTTSTPGAQTILAATDVRGYNWIEINYSSVGVGLALTGQYSQTSGGVYTSIASFGTTTVTTTAVLGVAVNTTYYGPIKGTFFQIAVSALTSGTFTGTVTLKAVPPPLQTMNVNINTGVATIGKVANTDTFGTTTVMTATLASLASSTAGVGRQSTLITANTARSAQIAVKVTMGTTPVAGSLVYVYLIRGDGTLNDDNAGAVDAAITVANAPLLGTLVCSTATTGLALRGLFDTKSLGSLGKTFGVAIVNATGAALDATAANHFIEYTTIT